MENNQTGMSGAGKQARKVFSEMELGDIAAAMENTPAPPKKLNKTEALDALLPPLKKALGKGHNLDSLCEVLNRQGLQINPRGLAKVLRSADTKKGKP